ncbi:MAG: pantoate--beta-alanine ligase [Bacteroidales bacterium]|nr:pantoate--beta-alanine ligase [Bacteroidales bacterium]
MKTFNTINETKKYLNPFHKKGQSIGFIPTMGALHEGHLTLIRKSKAANDLTVCSIFVNPIQFNNKEDLATYPRNLVSDSKLLSENGCDVLFAPEVQELYPESEPQTMDVDFGDLAKVMEGKFRPGHFNGVAIVVKKLFDIVNPTRSYFGKKDYQQIAIIRHMVDVLNIPIEIVKCETTRETDGLAMSSRNLRLTVGERKTAPWIHQVLLKVKEKSGTLPVGQLKEWAIKKIQEESSLKVEYFEIAEKESLMPVENWQQNGNAVALTAVFLGDVRLIDNIELF